MTTVEQIDLFRSLPVARIASWMDERGLGRGPIEGLERLGGGTQNLLVKFRRDGRDYVLRRPPAVLRANSNETMLREARVLSALADSDVPHAALIAACADVGVIGAAFYLMEPINGFNVTTGMPAAHAASPAMRRAMGFATVDAAAALGRVDYAAKGLADFGRADGFLERQVPRWRKQLASYDGMEGWPGPAGLPEAEDVADWLAERCPRSFAPGILHGDFHLANVLFRNDSSAIAAVVDWELATIGDPLLDLGWLIATWQEPDDPSSGIFDIAPGDGFPSSRELVDRYAGQTLRDLSQIDWYVVLASFKFAMIVEGTYARACAGKAPRDVGARLHAMAGYMLTRAMKRIDGAA